MKKHKRKKSQVPIDEIFDCISGSVKVLQSKGASDSLIVFALESMKFSMLGGMASLLTKSDLHGLHVVKIPEYLNQKNWKVKK